MITGVLLAAGEGCRFGGDKLAAELADGRVLASAAGEAMVAALPRVIAVVRPRQPQLAEALQAVGCAVIDCPEATAGMGASLGCGVRASPDADGWVIGLADMPWIRPATIRAVAAALAEGAPLAAPACDGRRGHPVGFSREFGKDLAALGGDAGARAILAANADRVRLIETDDRGVVSDVDTPADLDG